MISESISFHNAGHAVATVLLAREFPMGEFNAMTALAGPVGERFFSPAAEETGEKNDRSIAAKHLAEFFPDVLLRETYMNLLSRRVEQILEGHRDVIAQVAREHRETGRPAQEIAQALLSAMERLR